MASTYKTPGVYIEEISKFPPSVAQVETAIPAFIGYTEKAKKGGEDITLRPTRITSLLEYEEYFGGPQKEKNLVVTIEQETDRRTPKTVIKELVTADFGTDGPSKHLMYYALQTFFSNGGGPCYIISLAPYLATFGEAIPYDPMKAGLDAIEKEDEVTLIVFPEAQGMSLADQGTLYNDALAQCEKLKDRFVIMDLHHSGVGLSSSGDIMNEANNFRNSVTSSFLKYGGAYFPNIEVIFNYDFGEESAVSITHMVDGEAGDFNESTMDKLASALRSKAQLAINDRPINLPPSAAMAGIYARVDNSRGVWKAPANEGVNGVQKLSFKINNDIQDFLNVDTLAGKSINAIRTFIGKGTLVWGARTLDGNSNEWRYISVRRFFNMVEESVKKATARFVFEPNDANTWVKVRSMIENFLILQWKAGALAGPTPEAAFYVKVGLGETMTPLDILEGRMNVEIGMAAVRPAEFIILKFSHKMQEA